MIRILQTAASLQTAAFCFEKPHFASDGRVSLRTPVFCFGRPRFASDSCILLWTAAFCFGGQPFASHGRDCLCITREKYFALCNVHWQKTKDVMDPCYNEICLLARQGCYFTLSPRVSHLVERPNVMYFHELCWTYHQNKLIKDSCSNSAQNPFLHTHSLFSPIE